MHESDAHSANYLNDTNSISYLVEDRVWIYEATVGSATIISAWNAWRTHYGVLTEIGIKAKKKNLDYPSRYPLHSTLELLSSSFTANTWSARLDTIIRGSSSKSNLGFSF